MPLTFPAHQGLIAPIKLWWPRHVDATALCIGAAAPDLAYPLDPWWGGHSHDHIGLLVWAVPFTLLAAFVTRRWAAAGIFAATPDLGPLRLRSYRVLVRRRPAWWVTLVSAIVGAGSHVVIDAFTHRGRWGADLAGLNDEAGFLPVGGISEAKLLQYLGHTVGSLAFVVLLVAIASSGRLERWYGADEVQRARLVDVERWERLVFAAIVVAPVLIAIPVSLAIQGWAFFELVATASISTLAAGTWLGRRHPIVDDDGGRGEPGGPGGPGAESERDQALAASHAPHAD